MQGEDVRIRGNDTDNDNNIDNDTSSAKFTNGADNVNDTLTHLAFRFVHATVSHKQGPLYHMDHGMHPYGIRHQWALGQQQDTYDLIDILDDLRLKYNLLQLQSTLWQVYLTFRKPLITQHKWVMN